MLSVSCFEENQEVFLVDIQAEVVLSDIPYDLIFKCDQSGIHLLPAGYWTMHQAREKVIHIGYSDNK